MAQQVKDCVAKPHNLSLHGGRTDSGKCPLTRCDTVAVELCTHTHAHTQHVCKQTHKAKVLQEQRKN